MSNPPPIDRNSTAPPSSILFDASPLPISNSTKSPTAKPTKPPTDSPIQPSFEPSNEPPISPPTISPTKSPTKSPTASPSAIPTNPLTESPSRIPTAAPTSNPTDKPTPSPTNEPSKTPTVSPSHAPTTQPTTSQAPSPSPTSIPSSVPSARPTPSPSASPSATPTLQPTPLPTPSPTGSPTFSELSEAQRRFLQTYKGSNLQRMTPEQVVYFQNTLASYTQFYGPKKGEGEPGRVTTRCKLIGQTLSIGEQNFLEVDFEMFYTSPKTNVTELKYPDAFKNWMNSEPGKSRTLINLESVGVAVQEIQDVRTKVVPTTPPPTASPTRKPTVRPTNLPSVQPTERESVSPSSIPTDGPTRTLTTMPVTSRTPDEIPSAAPSTNQIIPVPSREKPSVAVIASVISAGAVTILIVVIFCYIRSRRQQPTPKKRRPVPLRIDTTGKDEKRANLRINIESAIPMNEASHHSRESSNDEYDSDEQPVPESLVSRESFISYGHSMSSDSVLERDETNVLADEFDQYKNPDLERMRTEVECHVANSDGMMSQAMTRALMMDDDESIRDLNELNWGAAGVSMEIEASVLCETNDWLKRKEGASLDERRAFMQNALNKMVASVRHNIVLPEEASRTIHGCAAMLGLQLADNIPETALIVTGMRKTVQRENVIQAFEEFGEIEDAAVAPKSRGFGLVRFRSPKFVQKALDKFKKEEIVVQDVAVMVRVLRSSLAQDLDHSLHDRDKNRKFAMGDPNAPAAAAVGRPPSKDKRTGMAARHSSDLDSLGYVDDSLGGRNVGRASRSRATGSESGTSVESRRSNRSRHSSRDPSAASSATDSRGGNRRRRHRSDGSGHLV